MLMTGTPVVPVFQSVTATGVDEVAPRPVGGNASPVHVITNVDGVTVEGDAAGALEQLEASAATMTTQHRAGRGERTLAATTGSIVATAPFAIV
jgi:hypothetical protein